MRVLVTGGLGYIGSHTCVSLMSAGVDLHIIDNLGNSSLDVVGRIAAITGIQPSLTVGDIRSREDLKAAFSQGPFDAVLHFAGVKAVGESVLKPIEYFDNNLTGTLVLVELMEEHACRHLIFSSSATVYGEPSILPLDESAALRPCNPYGRSKLFVEAILQDLSVANSDWRITCLRYFNPVGAHQSGLLGEMPRGTPSNLMPYVAQVAARWRDSLSIFGDDYPTRDGTGVRDYIHVVDLAAGHVSALRALAVGPAYSVVNLGTGGGYSVLEVIQAYERASGVSIPFKVVGRRPGDVAACYADPGQAYRQFGWKSQLGLAEMCADSWRWQSRLPPPSSAAHFNL